MVPIRLSRTQRGPSDSPRSSRPGAETAQGVYRSLRRLLACTLAFCLASLSLPALQAVDHQATGVLILAHGHEKTWNSQVESLAAGAGMPVEIALGMAHKVAMERAVRALEKRGVRRIVVVPLYVSSYSSIIRASAYLLGLREEAPPELELFNTMSHGLQDPHAGHAAGGHPVDLKPIQTSVPLVMTSALDDHPLVGDVLLDRARNISRRPSAETAILVAHGADDEGDIRAWKQALDRLAQRVREGGGFAEAESVILLDDAPAPVRDRAAAELRERVSRASSRGTALILPVLLSRGGIEAGLHQRLEGFAYRIPDQFLLPDARIGEWLKLKVDEGIRMLESADRSPGRNSGN